MYESGSGETLAHVCGGIRVNLACGRPKKSGPLGSQAFLAVYDTRSSQLFPDHTMDEKTNGSLLLPSQAPSSQDTKSKSTVSRAKAAICVTLFIFVQCLFWNPTRLDIPTFNAKSSESLCPQASELVPHKNGKIWRHLTETFSTDVFKSRAINWLGGAVRVP